MLNIKAINLRHTLLLLVFATAFLLAGSSMAVQGTVAGEISMLVGQAKATSATGEARSLKKGDQVFAGDTIETGKKCYLKIRYKDGGSVLLRPDTGLVIESYRDQGDDGGESVATLLKGGLRSVTGAISQERKAHMRIKTPVATLGIRGTDFVMRLCQEGEDKDKNDCDNLSDDGLYTSVYEGGTTLTNSGGSLDTDEGEHAYVKSFDIPPIQLSQAPRVISVDNLPNPLDSSIEFIPGNACGAP